MSTAGELTVEGSASAPLIIADDYSMVFNGKVSAQSIIGTAWKLLAKK